MLSSSQIVDLSSLIIRVFQNVFLLRRYLVQLFSPGIQQQSSIINPVLLQKETRTEM
jgi:hypothetical protein